MQVIACLIKDLFKMNKARMDQRYVEIFSKTDDISSVAASISEFVKVVFPNGM